jgi:hypothetical protein
MENKIVLCKDRVGEKSEEEKKKIRMRSPMSKILNVKVYYIEIESVTSLDFILHILFYFLFYFYTRSPLSILKVTILNIIEHVPISNRLIISFT